MILCGNPQAQYLAHKQEIDGAIARVLDKGRYILGEEAKAFETEFAAYCGATHAIGVANGTDAILLTLRAYGIGPGDEVVTVSHTAVATVTAIVLSGASPVLVDIQRDCYTMDPQRLEAAIGPRTKAIVPVHLYGQPADLGPILDVAARYGLHVIEDCAQAHGARYHGRRVGSLGAAGCFSFYPTKNLGALGDGGMVVTRDESLANRIRCLREYGWDANRVVKVPGFNSRLDEIQAAVLRVKLRYLDADNMARRERARRYHEMLADTPCLLPSCRKDAEHAFHLYVVRSAHRDELKHHLLELDVAALIHYSVPVHLQDGYLGRLRGHDVLPETEQAAGEILSLPLYPELAEEELQQVVRAINSFPWKRR